MAPLIALAHLSSLAEAAGVERCFSSDEQARLARISAAGRRAEFVGGHWLLRLGLAHRLGGQASDYCLCQPAASAPALPDYPALALGLSHSQGWLAAGLWAGPGKLGLDIELERPRPRLAQLAAYSFGEAWLQGQGDLLPAFFRRWTQCESVVKGSDKSLGTALLRGQRFAPGHRGQGLALHYARLDSRQHPLFETPLHLSLAGARPAPSVLLWTGSSFEPLAVAFDPYLALP